jgi:putative restriction endonuclease
MNPRAWSFLAIEGVRQSGGNTGYVDDPARVYRYDSDVANHRQIRRNDVVILRSRTRVLGIAKIETIDVGEGRKERLRCPICRATNIKERTTIEPRWACKNRHVFDEPIRESVAIRAFEAHYEGTFRTSLPGLTTARLQNAVLRPSDQMSIKEIDLAKLEDCLLEDQESRQLIVGYADAITEEIPDESAKDTQLLHSIIEARRRVLREIGLRRGQVQFRDRLIRRYGGACQISRCAFTGVVEAAHILPYADTNENSLHNGLLLRSDLHTLFDLGLLAINPMTRKVALHPALLKTEYASFDGIPLFMNGTNGPARAALTDRWDFFQAHLEGIWK